MSHLTGYAIIAILAVIVAGVTYVIGRADGIRQQKDVTLSIIRNQTKPLSYFHGFVRNDAETVLEVQRQAESTSSLFCMIFNISDEELAELKGETA